MRELINVLLEKVWSNSEIPEELLYEFSKETMTIVMRRSTTDVPENFLELERYVELFWRGKGYKSTSDPGIIYQMGRLLSYTNMLSMLMEEHEKSTSLEDYAKIYRRWYKIFKGVYEEKGITHNKLSEEADMSVSSLSQFMGRVKPEGFFTYRMMGREKHYYLTEYGQSLYLHMEGVSRNDKYKKIYGLIDNLNEQISNDIDYKVLVENGEKEELRSVFIKNQENGLEKILGISVCKNGFGMNKEEEKWRMEG